MKLVAVSGTILGSKTSASLTQLLEVIKKHNPEIDVELIDLKDYKLEFVDGRPSSDYNEDTQTLIHKIMEADAYVIGSPVFQASIPGTLKNLFDSLSPNTFKNKVVGIVMNGGSERHSLVLEYQLKPILNYFKAYIPSSNVFLHTSDFDAENHIQDPEMVKRLTTLADEIVFMAKQLKQ